MSVACSKHVRDFIALDREEFLSPPILSRIIVLAMIYGPPKFWSGAPDTRDFLDLCPKNVTSVEKKETTTDRLYRYLSSWSSLFTSDHPKSPVIAGESGKNSWLDSTTDVLKLWSGYNLLSNQEMVEERNETSEFVKQGEIYGSAQKIEPSTEINEPTTHRFYSYLIGWTSPGTNQKSEASNEIKESTTDRFYSYLAGWTISPATADQPKSAETADESTKNGWFEGTADALRGWTSYTYLWPTQEKVKDLKTSLEENLKGDNKAGAVSRAWGYYKLMHGNQYLVKTSETASAALQILDKAAKNSKPILHIDRPHATVKYVHMNINPKYAGIKKDPHLWLPPGTDWASASTMNLLKKCNSGIEYAALGLTAYELYRAIHSDIQEETHKNKVEVVARVGTAMAAGAIGGQTGAIVGTAIMPGIGTIIGGLAGSIPPAIYAGSAASAYVDQNYEEAAKKVVEYTPIVIDKIKNSPQSLEQLADFYEACRKYFTPKL